MGWSIKKPLGSRRSVLRQVARVAVAPVAAPVLQTIGLKHLAGEVSDGVYSAKNLKTIGTTGQVIGASILAGAALGALAPAQTTTITTTQGAGNIFANPQVVSTTTRPGFFARAWQGAKIAVSAVGKYVTAALGLASAASPFIPKGAPERPQAAPGQDAGGINITMPGQQVLPWQVSGGENAGSGGGGGEFAALMPATADNSKMLIIAGALLFSIAAFLVFKKKPA